MSKRYYRVGIDVGNFSTGLSAIEIDIKNDNPTLQEILDAKPIKILNAVSYIHDASIYDPKTAVTRKERAGIVRRAKRRMQTKRKRLKNLDSLLEKNGFPVILSKELSANMPKGESPIFQWEIRSNAARDYIENDQERMLAATISILHIARHRGWRNAYSSFESLEKDSKSPSSFYQELILKVLNWLDEHEVAIPIDFSILDENRPTPGQLIYQLQKHCPDIKIRGNASIDDVGDGENIPMGKLHQSDYYNELSRILKMQRIDPTLSKKILEAVFKQINPRDVAAAANLVGKDAIQPDHPRASHSSIAFQEFRILTTISNLQIQENGSIRKLEQFEKKQLFELLTSPKAVKTKVDWNDVAQTLNIDRSDLKGVGGETEDGDPISAKYPPTLDTDISLKKLFNTSQSFAYWWDNADTLKRELFLASMDNAGVPDFFKYRYSDILDEIASLLESFDETTLSVFDAIDLPSGRSSYGIDTLQRLNKRMLEGMNLHEARKAEFGIPDNWRPAPNPLGTLVGNGAADRVIKIVSRWILACEEKWGTPIIVNIEHVRSGFKSVKTARKIQKEQDNRFKEKQRIRKELEGLRLTDIKKAMESSDDARLSNHIEVRSADIRKQQALERQNSQCLYCGKSIAFDSAEMDHIIPRKHIGSSNDIYNLAAVCHECNASKSNTLYYEWAAVEKRKEAIQRVKQMTKSAYFSVEEFKHFKKEVIARLQQTEADDDLDTRSFESVAWMARELRRQIEGHLRDVDTKSHCYEIRHETNDSSNEQDSINLAEHQRVYVYQGWVTSTARKIGKIEKALPWIGESNKKDRLDRRHHAIDASIIAMMNPGVAQMMAIQNELRRGCFDQTGSRNSYKANENNILRKMPHFKRFEIWRTDQMDALRSLLIEKMHQDNIPVVYLKRLKLENNDAHKETIYKATKKKLGESISSTAINKAATKALWKALVSLPDYDSKHGLPENPNRSIRVNGETLYAQNEITFLAPRVKKTGENKAAFKLDKEDGIAYKVVRGGIVELGSNIHHSRIYKLCSDGKCAKPSYYQMRVYQADLLNVKTDLFEYELPEFSFSCRFAEPKLRHALQEGTAEYLGWIVVNDEIQIDPQRFKKNMIGDFFSIPDFSNMNRFVVSGYESNTQLKLRPALLSSEGLDGYIERHPELTEAQLKSLKTVLKDKGWRPSINDLMRSGVKIIRRNTLGFVRWKSNNHMPISWSTDCVDQDA